MAKKRRSSPRRPPVSRSTAHRTTARRAPTPGRLGRRLEVAGFVAVALTLLLPPFVVWPSLDEAFRLPKLFASEVLAAVSLVLLAFRIGGGERRPASVLRHPAVLAGGPLLLVAVVGAWLGPHPQVVREALPTFALGVAVLMGWSLALGERERWRLLSLLGWPAAILAALAVLQYHQLVVPFDFANSISRRLELTSLAGGAYDLSGYLVLPFLVLQARWSSAGRRERILLGVALGLFTYAFAVTRTLTALLAVLVGAGLLLARQLPRRARPRIAAGLVVVLAVLALATPIGTRAAKKFSNLAESGDWNRFLTGRLDGWRAAGWMLGEHPILGVGHGAYRSEFGQARLALQDEGVTFYRNHRLPFFTHAHNEVLHVAAEGGLLGLAALAWALFVLARAQRRRPASSSEDDGDSTDDETDSTPFDALRWPALAALAILAIGYFPFHVALQAFPWLLFLAAALDRPASGDGAKATAGPAVPGRILTAITVLVLVGVGLATLDRARRGMAREAMLQQLDAQVALLWQERDRLPPRQLEAALRAHLEILDRLAADAPTDVRIPMAVGGRYYLMRRYDAAARAYRDAAALETRAEVYLNLARSLRAAGELDASAEAARTVLRLGPRERRSLEALGLLPGEETGDG